MKQFKGRFARNYSTGELIDINGEKMIKQRFKPDNNAQKQWFVWAMMAICVVADFAQGTSYFSTIARDNPLLIIAQLSGFMLIYDGLPYAMGVLDKQIDQGLRYEKSTLYACLAVFILFGCVLIPVTRIISIQRMYPGIINAGNSVISVDGSYQYALLLIAIFMPIATSVFLYFLSKIAYDPLQNKEKFETLQVWRSQQTVYQLEGIRDEYRAMGNIRQILKDYNRAGKNQAYKEALASLINGTIYARTILIKEFNDPKASTALNREEVQKKLEFYDACIQKFKKMLYDLEEQPETDPTPKPAPSSASDNIFEDEYMESITPNELLMKSLS